jgi:hypothetical protein
MYEGLERLDAIGAVYLVRHLPPEKDKLMETAAACLLGIPTEENLSNYGL